MVGRGRYVDYDPRAPLPGLAGGRAVVDPDILADAQACPRAVEIQHGRGPAAREVSLLVEDAVVGEVHLPVTRGDTAPVEERGAVVDRAPAASRRFGGADYDRYSPGGAGEGLELTLAVLEEGLFEQEVFGRVPAEDELGEGEQLHAAPFRLADPAADDRRVPFQVPQGGVDLGQSYPDLPSAAHARMIPFAAPGGETKSRPGRPPRDRRPRAGNARSVARAPLPLDPLHAPRIIHGIYISDLNNG